MPFLAMLAALALCQSSAAVAAPSSDRLYVPGHRWALIVGAGDYEHLGRLRYAEKDARGLAQALVAHLGFEEDHVRVLVDHPDEPELSPTAGHVLGELESLLADRR